MSYCSISDVSGKCLNLLGTETSFSTTTKPNATDVTGWISNGCSIIDTQLSAWGYDVPAGAGTVAYGWFRELNALYAAAQAELSRTVATLSIGERTRGQVFDKMFWDGLARLESLDLTGVGATRSSAGTVFVGGISQVNKDTQTDNTDRVQPRFKRGMLNWNS
jgi:hypothetical protein